jgi:hypothetical protein
MKKTLLLFLFLLPFLSISQTDLAKWDASNTGNRFLPVVNSVSAENVTVNPTTGLTAISINYNNTWDSSNPFFMTGGWPNPQEYEGSYDSNRYIEFRIKPTTGNKVDLTTFNFTYRSQGNPQKFQIQYSKDNTFTNNVKTLVAETNTTSNWTTINPTFSSQINPVLAGEILYVRVYVYGSNDNFHFRAGTSGANNLPPVIKGAVSSFDSNKILAINDYISTIKNRAINIAPLANDVKKENVSTIVITNQPLAIQGTVIINPDKTLTFNPAKDFTGTASFKYQISNSTDPASEAIVEVTITDDTSSSLVIWDGKSSANRYTPTVLSPYVSANQLDNSKNSMSYNNSEDSSNPFYNTGGWPSANTVNNTKFVEFRITADANHRVDLSTFGLTYRNQGNNDQQTFKIDYSKSSTFSSNVKSLAAPTITTNNWVTINPTFASDLNFLLPGETIYIRLYVYNTNNNFQFRTKTNIKGSIKDTDTLLANDDYKSTPSNQAITIKVLENDVVGSSALQPITVTQPANGTVTVNAANEVTFTPANGFSGTTSFTYTLQNAIPNYSSATVYINGTAPLCSPVGDQTTSGANSWIGYVYSWTGNVWPNPAGPATLPISANATYIGTVTEVSPNFDRNIGTGPVAGSTTNITCSTPPSDRFFVRYKMKTTTTAGIYNFSIGGDDGVRLYVDDKLVDLTPANVWARHSYTIYAGQVDLSAGEHTFVLEYFEYEEVSRVSFSYGEIKGDVSLPYGINTWNVYGFSVPDLTLPAKAYAGTYVDNRLSFDTNTLWSNKKSPSAYSEWKGAPIADDQFAITYKRKGFPCGNYQIQLVNCDDVGEIYLDGVRIFRQDHDINTLQNVGTYTLNSGSRIDILLRENAGNANIAVNFNFTPTVYDGSTTLTNGASIAVTGPNVILGNDVTVCSCTIKNGAKLTVPNGRTLTVDDALIFEGTGKILISNGGSLLQNNTTSSAFQGGTASFEMQRSTSTRRYDYTYWSSPLTLASGFTLKKMSPNTLADKYTSYDPNASWVIRNAEQSVMVPGEGYSVRGPQNFDITTPGTQTASFVGVPNNGDVLKTTVQNKFNLLGNPYPSAIDGYKLINDTKIGTVYLWTHNTPPANDGTSNKYKYSSSDYASFNLSGGIKTGGNTSLPTRYIAAGQGFFAAPTTTSITYTNSMRVGGSNSTFYKTEKTNDLERNRIWLNLSNAEGAFKQTLVGYIEGATNSWDLNFDAVGFNGNSYVDFYSINENTILSIQGRALPFEKSDVVPLGYKVTVAGDFTISIDQVDGFFDDQEVYLEDKKTGIISNLKTGNYTFKTEAGTFKDRFTLRYTNKTLGTDDFENVDGGLLVSVKDKVIKVTSVKENIKEVNLFDISGRLIYQKAKVGTTELSISNLQSSDQILLVKVILENEYTTTKKVIFK